eukprot:SAG22_NODE_8648_length_639_cov_1.551852_1_plen_63_part_01
MFVYDISHILFKLLSTLEIYSRTAVVHVRYIYVRYRSSARILPGCAPRQRGEAAQLAAGGAAP